MPVHVKWRKVLIVPRDRRYGKDFTDKDLPPVHIEPAVTILNALHRQDCFSVGPDVPVIVWIAPKTTFPELLEYI